jgi:hypothetical protein
LEKCSGFPSDRVSSRLHDKVYRLGQCNEP